MNLRFIGAVACCIGSLGVLHAQSSSLPAEEWIQHVFSHHVAQAAADLEPALRRQQEEVRFRPAPFQASAFYLTPGSSPLPDYTEWQLDQSGVLPPVGKARRAVVDAAETTGVADRAVFRQNLWWKIADHIFAWLALQDESEVVARQIDSFEAVMQAAEQRFAAGESTILEVEQARWGVAELRTVGAELAARSQAMERQLEAWCGGTLPAASVTAGAYAELGPLELGEVRLPAEVAAEAANGYAEAEWMRARRERLPEWTLGYNAQGVTGEVYGGVFAGLAIPLRGARSGEELAALERNRVRYDGERRVAEARAERTVWAERYEALRAVRPIWSEALAESSVGAVLDLAYTTHHFSVAELHRLLNARFQAERELIHLDEELRRLRARLRSSFEMPQS
jgi:outer membrane protein TolC